MTQTSSHVFAREGTSRPRQSSKSKTPEEEIASVAEKLLRNDKRIIIYLKGMNFSYTYMMTNVHHTVIYTGVTSNLIKRVYQHKTKAFKGFTSRYNCEKLVYYQQFSNISEAIDFEKKIKAGNRAKKERLISEQNPEWKDLSEVWLFAV